MIARGRLWLSGFLKKMKIKKILKHFISRVSADDSAGGAVVVWVSNLKKVFFM